MHMKGIFQIVLKIRHHFFCKSHQIKIQHKQVKGCKKQQVSFWIISVPFSTWSVDLNSEFPLEKLGAHPCVLEDLNALDTEVNRHLVIDLANPLGYVEI